MAYRIMVTLRFRVRHRREIRRFTKGIPTGFNGEVFPKIKMVSNMSFLKQIKFFHFPS